MPPPPPAHRWYTPDDCAALLLAVKHGNGYRAPCPVHRGDSTTALHIFLGTDKYGHPKTVLYCHAHQCPRAAICAEMGIEIKNLYSIQPAYAKATKYAPRAHSPILDTLMVLNSPSPDEIALLLILDDIATAPQYVTEPTVEGLDGTQVPNPERVKLWELAQGSPQAKAALTKALAHAGFIPTTFWQALADEQRD